MRRVLILILSVTFAPTPLLAQRFTPRLAPSPSGSESAEWDAVLNLPEGTRLEIANRAGAIVEGTLRSVNLESVVLNREGAAIEMPRPSVGRVVQLGARTTGKSARQGFLIGAAAGVTQAALTVETNRGRWMLILASIEGAIGATIGALAATRERTLIYAAADPA